VHSSWDLSEVDARIVDHRAQVVSLDFIHLAEPFRE
jgi:hypothetical protein